MAYIVYIGFVILSLGLVAVEHFIKNDKIKLIPFVALLSVYFFLAILKSKNVGIDTQTYSDIYKSLANQDFKTVLKTRNIEIGFFGLGFLFSHILRFHETVFIFVCFLIISTCLFLSFFKSEHKTAYLCIFMFVGFFCMSFSGLRQSIAISIATLAFTILFSDSETKYWKKLIVYLLLIAVASLFHKTALILLAVPVITLLFVDKYAIPYFPLLVFLFAPFMFGRLIILTSFYNKSKSGNTNVFDGRISVTLFIEAIFVLVFYLLYFTKVGKKMRDKIGIQDFEYNQTDSNYLMLIYLSCLFVAFNSATTIVTRLSMYFYLGISYYLVKIGKTIKNKNIQLIYYLGVVGLLGVYFVLNTPVLGLVPYEFK